MFKSKEKFNQAVNLLTNKRLGKYVQDLCVDEMDYSLQVYWLFQHFFLTWNVQTWHDNELHNSRRDIGDFNAMMYAQIAVNQTNLGDLKRNTQPYQHFQSFNSIISSQ